MDTSKYLLPGKAILHYIHNGKTIEDDQRLKEVAAEFPDSGEVRSKLLALERDTLPGYYTHVYLHNDRNREPEIDSDVNSYSKYPLEK